MSLSGNYLFGLDGYLMSGNITASDGYNPVSAESMLGYLRNCNQSRITGVVSAEGLPIDNACRCNIHISKFDEHISIKIEDWKTGNVLFGYNGIICKCSLIEVVNSEQGDDDSN